MTLLNTNYSDIVFLGLSLCMGIIFMHLSCKYMKKQ